METIHMPKEAVWAIGFIVGAIATSLVLGLFGVDGILRLILLIGGGVGVGVLSETIAKRET